ncbi:hypothetical protein KEM48_007910 [Puccinia striiformis f. sp. tritici PST-130]|nr:hypothetical protein KEM48_007910 [Puccinia striiformis f. sp. tritici PST-130]
MPIGWPIKTGPSNHWFFLSPSPTHTISVTFTFSPPSNNTSISSHFHHHQLTNPTNMISGIYAACFLAAFATATPVDHQARQISSLNQASGSGHQSTSTSQTTPWGLSSSHQSSSYAYQSSSQVIQGFSPIVSLLGDMQALLAQGTMSQSIAMSSMNQLVGQLQPVMGGLIQCGCIGGGGIGSMFNDVFGQLTQVVQGLQTNFPGAGFNSLMMPFGQMLPTMQSFVSSYSQNSAFTSYAQTLNPFVNLIGGAVPGFGGLSTGL